MKRILICALLFTVILTALIPTALCKKPAVTTLVSENFQGYAPVKPWKPINGWSSERTGSCWAITTIGDNRVLQSFKSGNSDDITNSEDRLLIGNDNWTDMTVTVKVKVTGDSFSGITRVKNGGDTYDIFITNNNFVVALRRAKPVDTTLATAGFLINPDTFYTMKVVFSGSRITVFMNNNATALINVDAGIAEQGHKPCGKIGLFSKISSGNFTTSFDNLVVTKP